MMNFFGRMTRHSRVEKAIEIWSAQDDHQFLMHMNELGRLTSVHIDRVDSCGHRESLQESFR